MLPQREMLNIYLLAGVGFSQFTGKYQRSKKRAVKLKCYDGKAVYHGNKICAVLWEQTHSVYNNHQKLRLIRKLYFCNTPPFEQRE